MSVLAIELDGIGLAFPLQRKLMGRRHWALEHVSLRLAHGDKLGVIGRNGAGKSTLLRVLAGALVPDRGRVVRHHGSVQLLAINLGFVQHLSGRENAILGGLLQGLTKQQIARKLPAIADFADIGEFFDQPISTYSSGMVSRLGFSVAMQLEPDILLIDETLSVGDDDFRKKSSAALRERFSGEHTVVLVSHSEAMISQLCNKVLWVEHGRSIMTGPTCEVLAAYGKAAAPSAPEEALDPGDALV